MLPVILLVFCAIGGFGGSFVVMQKCNTNKLFCNFKRFSRSLESSLRFKPLYLLVLAILSLIYLVYLVFIYAILAVFAIALASLIFGLTYAVLIVPSYVIFLVVVVRK